MKNTLILFLSMAAIFLAACQEQTPEQKAENALRDEVMVVHDEVMPKMGEMHQLKRKLEKLSKTDAVTDTAAVSTAIVMLENADEGMMSWMNQFKQPSKLRGDQSHEEILAYLNEEKAKIRKVKEDMLTSIKNAKNILAGYSEAE